MVQLIHQCISTVNFTPLLNGYKSASFTTFRGIRQRDPLSPYLFILCSELLDRLINREVVNGSIKGVTLAPNAPIISKLSYADDVILFCGARISEVARLMECVDKFCGWSGLIVNRDKFGIFTSKGVHPQFIRQIMSQWGFKLLPKDSKYLGLPLFLSANKSKDLAFIKEKLEARVCGWKGKCLSWMGRATLIKPVAQATPIYGMSAFKFLKKLCVDLDAICRKFWWSPTNEGNKFYTPMAWANLCKPLCEGGLGFRLFESFNETMIAKLAWWVLSNRDSFCIRVLRAKYKVGNSWLQANPASFASFTWKGLESARPLLIKRACRLVGFGTSILVWRDPWISDLPSYTPSPRDNLENPQVMAMDQLMKPEKRG